ncbi:hypothetical protein BpHYR1_016591 [Brachionus plicatilis]|uniref:Uncharacterized protein n=1 Tax=Brachionus plicatilis TaxID=10195 RepID=A0A3M7SK97_BRAPC|nr:hypothetical protein BpHYR1_016591 [Brachionus plicatilis]
MNSKIRTSVKLKIPPAFEPDVWVCNHSKKKSVQTTPDSGSVRNHHSTRSSAFKKKLKFLSMKQFDKQMNRKFEQLRLARREKIQSPYSKRLLLSEYKNSKNLVPKKHKSKKKIKRYIKMKIFSKKKYGYKKIFKRIKNLDSRNRTKVNQLFKMGRKETRKKLSFIKQKMNKKANCKNLKELNDSSSFLEEYLINENDLFELSSVEIPESNKQRSSDLNLTTNFENESKTKLEKVDIELNFASFQNDSHVANDFGKKNNPSIRKNRKVFKKINSNGGKIKHFQVESEGLQNYKSNEKINSIENFKTTMTKKRRHSTGSLKGLNKVKYDSNMTNYERQNSNSIFEFTEPNLSPKSFWIDSGKTQLGLKIDRFIRRYKKLSKQKKYLLFFIIVLLFFTTLSFLIIFILLLLGPTYQYFIINNLESNASHILSTKKNSLTSLPNSQNDTIVKNQGLVGDFCIKVVGDCSKYMECKKHNSLLSNISTCQCINGFIADSNRTCKGIAKSYCQYDSDCWKDLVCNKNQNKCICKNGYLPRPDGTCFGRYNSTCETDEDCLKNGECAMINWTENKKVCRCSTRKRAFYLPDNEPSRQCRLLVGARCDDDQDCVENARCSKYCSCKETDLFFETENFFCEDACQVISKNTHSKSTKYPHPRKCGYHFSCSPRDLDLCPSNYSFDFDKQSCNSSILCH